MYVCILKIIFIDDYLLFAVVFGLEKIIWFFVIKFILSLPEKFAISKFYFSKKKKTIYHFYLFDKPISVKY